MFGRFLRKNHLIDLPCCPQKAPKRAKRAKTCQKEQKSKKGKILKRATKSREKKKAAAVLRVVER
jgi:hypothetical protein